jgi:hypothetical protein
MPINSRLEYQARSGLPARRRLMALGAVSALCDAGRSRNWRGPDGVACSIGCALQCSRAWVNLCSDAEHRGALLAQGAGRALATLARRASRRRWSGAPPSTHAGDGLPTAAIVGAEDALLVRANVAGAIANLALHDQRQVRHSIPLRARLTLMC